MKQPGWPCGSGNYIIYVRIFCCCWGSVARVDELDTNAPRHALYCALSPRYFQGISLQLLVLPADSLYYMQGTGIRCLRSHYTEILPQIDEIYFGVRSQAGFSVAGCS